MSKRKESPIQIPTAKHPQKCFVRSSPSPWSIPVSIHSASFNCKFHSTNTLRAHHLCPCPPQSRTNKHTCCRALGRLYGNNSHLTSGPSFHLRMEIQHWDKFNSKAHKHALINTYHISINRCVDISTLCSGINSFIEIKINCAFG